MPFRDRADGGRRLAERITALHLTSPIVLGLPRGGVPVAAEVAAALRAPLDVFVARKVALPGHEEFGVGAVAEGIYDPVRSGVVDDLGVNKSDFEAFAQQARHEVDRRVRMYRGARALPHLAGRDVVLVDDGLATGVTAEAAVRSLRAMSPARVVVAAPVCAEATAQRLARIADDVVCVETPADLVAVGHWYHDFTQITDDEVIALLTGDPSVEEVLIATDDGVLRGDLTLPPGARGVVVFAASEGGSSRASITDRYVAEHLQAAGFATLLLDMEAHAGAAVAARLAAAAQWLEEQRGVRVPIGYIGAEPRETDTDGISIP
ncbi:MAG: putative phosphoribosyl transferase [Actinomycetota bacterium]|jgi:putative phosphoribosyl transferase